MFLEVVAVCGVGIYIVGMTFLGYSYCLPEKEAEKPEDAEPMLPARPRKRDQLLEEGRSRDSEWEFAEEHQTNTGQ